MRFVTAQKIFSLFLLAALFGVSGYNAYWQKDNLRDSLAGLVEPDSEKELRDDVNLLDDAAKTHLVGKTNFLEAYAYFQRLLGKNEIDNFSYVRAKNGAVNFGNFYEADISGLEKYAARLRRMKLWLEGGGGKLLFLTPPDLVVWGNPEYDMGMPYRNANPLQDAFLDHLRANGVECLDSRYVLRDSGLPLDRIMFRTDHHWTNEASFAVFKALVDKMGKMTGKSLDPDGFYRDDANYGFHTYPKAFLGFMGRSTGINFSGMEDFTAIWPRFGGEYRVEYIDRFGFFTREGPPEESILDTRVFQPGDPYGMTMFDFYLSGIKTWTRVVNRKNPDGPKLLFIHDSFGPPIACFLAPMFSEIHMMWPAAETFGIDIDKYMAEQKFDFALVELYPYNYNEQGMRFFVEEENAKPGGNERQ